MVIAQGDVELHADHSPQSDQPIVPETPGVVVVVVVVVMVVLIASLLIDCFLPVFLYIPVTVQPFWVANKIETPFVHLDFFGMQFGTTFETLLQSSL